MIDDERFFKLVDKEKFTKLVNELASDTQGKCGAILLSTLTMNHEEMRKLNEGPTQDMSDFCHRFEQAVADRILAIGKESGIKARQAVENGRRTGKYE